MLVNGILVRHAQYICSSLTSLVYIISKVFKYKTWRRKGAALPEVVEEYKSLGADLNVMPYCSQFIPMEVINMPKHKSICYHPSILPRHRGASAIREI